MTDANYMTMHNEDINTGVSLIYTIFTCNLMRTHRLYRTQLNMSDSENTYLVGKRFPNRLFVGGLPPLVTAPELATYFSHFGAVIDSKVILDDEGISKGYGFVSFKSTKDVQKVCKMGTLFLRNKKLNLGPAVKKEGPSIGAEVVIVKSAPSKGEFFYPAMPYQQPPQQTIQTAQYEVPQYEPFLYYYPPASPVDQFNNNNYQPYPGYCGLFPMEVPAHNNVMVNPILPQDYSYNMPPVTNKKQRRTNLPPRLKTKRSH